MVSLILVSNGRLKMDIEEVKEKLRGPAVSMATPMKKDFKIDFKSLRENVQFLIENGFVNGKGVIMAVAAAGECPSLTLEERKKAMKVVAEEAKGKVPLVTSAQDCSINTVIELANYAGDFGYDAVQVSSPFYYPVNSNEVYQFFKMVSENINVGIMVYNTPWLNNGFSIDLHLMDKLIELNNVVSFKWWSPDYACYIEAYKKYADKVSFLDNTINPTTAHMLGVRMWLAITANFTPKYVLNIDTLLEKRKYKEAIDELLKLHIPYYEWIHEVEKEGIHGEGAIIKPAMEMVGLPVGPARPPFNHKLNEEQRERLRNILVNGGLKVVK